MYDIIVIGAGPAGMTAAIYALRAGKKVLVVEKENVGGQIVNSPKVENYPGFAQISGSDFADALMEQVTSLGADFAYREAKEIVDCGDKKTVICGKKSFDARCVIIASGSKHKKLGIADEDRLVGAGVSYCAVCDGAFFAHKDVAVCGGGNTALQDALYLADICRKVYLIHRRTEFRGDAELAERLKYVSNVEIITPCVIKKLVGDNELSSLLLDKNGDEKTIEVSGLFIAVGQKPETENFADVIKLDSAGYAASGEDCKTVTEGIFVAGDCREKNVRQLTTAVGDGSAAAVAAAEYLNNTEKMKI